MTTFNPQGPLSQKSGFASAKKKPFWTCCTDDQGRSSCRKGSYIKNNETGEYTRDPQCVGTQYDKKSNCKRNCGDRAPSSGQGPLNTLL